MRNFRLLVWAKNAEFCFFFEKKNFRFSVSAKSVFRLLVRVFWKIFEKNFRQFPPKNFRFPRSAFRLLVTTFKGNLNISEKNKALTCLKFYFNSNFSSI